jgi:hypothetical protein
MLLALQRFYIVACIPLLCKDRDMGGYIRLVSGQRLGKDVPAAIVTHATGETGCSICVPRRDVIKRGELGQPVS